jgi:hypothetical protein
MKKAKKIQRRNPKRTRKRRRRRRRRRRRKSRAQPNKPKLAASTAKQTPKKRQQTAWKVVVLFGSLWLELAIVVLFIQFTPRKIPTMHRFTSAFKEPFVEEKKKS